MSALSNRALQRCDERLFAAHEQGDMATMATLYSRIARHHAACADPAAEAYFLTQAYISALHAGSPDWKSLRERLVQLGCERA